MKRTYTFVVMLSLLLSCGKDPGGTENKQQSVIPDVHAVDLGLSVKWADANVGAESPSDYGIYYAWGEIEPKADYTWSTYKWTDGANTAISKYGAKDGLSVLEPADDICTVAYGGKWRMPTEQEWTELQKGCSWEKIVTDGKFEGYKVRSKSSDAYIMLPVAGGWQGSSIYRAGYAGFYWASDLYEKSSSYAKVFQIVEGGLGTDHGTRSFGLTVRAVLAE